MARIKRIVIPNTPHHITQRGVRSLKRLNLIEKDKLLSDYEPIDNIVNYKEFLEETTNNKIIQEKTKTGKPCGDNNFYDKIKLLTGIDYKNKKAGRPKKDEQ